MVSLLAYTLGKNLIFASNNQSYVEVVGLYDGSDPKVENPEVPFLGREHITLSDRSCHRE
jgi:hypothetical protein